MSEKVPKFCLIIIKKFAELKRKKIRFVSIDKENKINERLIAMSNFNTNNTNILVGQTSFLRGLGFANIDHLVFFEQTDDVRDYIKLMGKLKTSVDNKKTNCIVFI